MSSYLSSLLTTTTSRYNSLRRALLSDEGDGDTEDDTHICRVLRAYYSEKGRPFPQWLPPDPKAPQAAPAQFVSSSRMPMHQHQSNYGQQLYQQEAVHQSQPVRMGGLSDLWDSSPAQQLAPPQGPSSLRKGGPARVRGEQSYSSSDTYGRQESLSQGRPLPSQRAGSYQSQHSQYNTNDSYSSTNNSSILGRSSPTPTQSSPAVTPAASSAQERLKARLWGNSGSSNNLSGAGRSSSPSPSVTSTHSASDRFGSRTPYDRGNSYVGGSISNATYTNSQNNYGHDNGARNARPHISSSATSSQGGYGVSDRFGGHSAAMSGGGGGGGGAYPNARFGGRERPGLPSGPKTYR